MRRLTELVSKPVISLYEGRTEGTIKNVIFNKALKSIKWLVLFDDKDMLEQKYISVKEIFNIGDTAVVIKNNQNIIPNIAQVDAKQNNPINCSVYTVTGDFINTVCDVILDDNFNTLSLELKNGTQIEKEKLVVTGQDAIILQDENNPVHINSFRQKKVPKIKTFEHNQKVHIMSASTKTESKEVEMENSEIENIENKNEQKLEDIQNENKIVLKNEQIKPEVKENKKPKTPKIEEKPEKEKVPEKEPFVKKEKEEEIKIEKEPALPEPEILPEVTKSKEDEVSSLYINETQTEIIEESKNLTEDSLINEMKKESEVVSEPENEVLPEIKVEEEQLLKEPEPTIKKEDENTENESLEKIDKELEEAKKQLKHKKTKLKEEIDVLKKQVKNIIKPKQKQPNLEKTLPVKKHNVNVFNESMSKPLRLVSNNTFLVNRIATKMIQTPNGEVIVKPGQKITQNMVELSFLTGKTHELIKFSK